jgi:hypothetical protein
LEAVAHRARQHLAARRAQPKHRQLDAPERERFDQLAQQRRDDD